MEVWKEGNGSPLGKCIEAASDEAKPPREEVQGARAAARAAVDIAEPATKLSPDRRTSPQIWTEACLTLYP